MNRRQRRSSTMMQIQENQDSLWQDYWRERVVSLQNAQGKRSVLTTACTLVTAIASQSNQPVRILELGCGEGHILGEVVELCNERDVPVARCVGIDREAGAIENARLIYPAIDFSVADYASEPLDLPPFDLVMLVGTLHEVYSANYSTSLRGIDHAFGKQAVERALLHASQLVRSSGYLILFDGIETLIPRQFQLTVRFQSKDAWEEYEKFATEYEAFPIIYEVLEPCQRIRLSIRDFTRYITKTRFINTNLWSIERRESYQYFNEDEFRRIFVEVGFDIKQLRCSSPHLTDWQDRVTIETDGVSFPNEHILIVGQSQR